MNGNGGGRESLRERYRPGQVTRAAVIVPYQKTAGPPDGVADRERRSRGRQRRQEGNSAAPEHPQSRSDAAEETAKPAQATAAEQQIRDRLLPAEFQRPQQLRADKAADHTCDSGIDRGVWKPASSNLTSEHTDPYERCDGDENSKAGDLEITNPKNYWVHVEG